MVERKHNDISRMDTWVQNYFEQHYPNKKVIVESGYYTESEINSTTSFFYLFLPDNSKNILLTNVSKSIQLDNIYLNPNCKYLISSFETPEIVEAPTFKKNFVYNGNVFGVANRKFVSQNQANNGLANFLWVDGSFQLEDLIPNQNGVYLMDNGTYLKWEGFFNVFVCDELGNKLIPEQPIKNIGTAYSVPFEDTVFDETGSYAPELLIEGQIQKKIYKAFKIRLT